MTGLLAGAENNLFSAVRCARHSALCREWNMNEETPVGGFVQHYAGDSQVLHFERIKDLTIGSEAVPLFPSVEQVYQDKLITERASEKSQSFDLSA